MTNRRDTNNSRIEGEDSFRQLVESLPELVWTCTPEGKCSYLSPQWIEYTGISEAAQLDFGWTEHIYTDDIVRSLDGLVGGLRLRLPF